MWQRHIAAIAAGCERHEIDAAGTRPTETNPDADDVRAAHRHPRRHVRSNPHRPCRSRQPRRSSSSDLTQLLVMPSHIPPHRPQPHRLELSPFRDGGDDGGRPRPAGAPPISSCWSTAPRSRPTRFAHFHEQRLRRGGAVLHHRRRRVRRNRDVEATTRPSSSGPTSPWCRARATRSTRCRRALPQLAARMRPPRRCGPRAGSAVAIGRSPGDAPVIFLIDAPTADVSATAIRQRRAERRSRSPGWSIRACSNTLNSMDFTRRSSRSRRADERVDHPGGRQVAWSKLRDAERRRDFPQQITVAIAAAEEKQARESGGARLEQGRSVHRLLRDLLGDQPAANSRDRRRGDGDRWPKAAASRRTSKATSGPNGS